MGSDLLLAFDLTSDILRMRTSAVVRIFSTTYAWTTQDVYDGRSVDRKCAQLMHKWQALRYRSRNAAAFFVRASMAKMCVSRSFCAVTHMAIWGTERTVRVHFEKHLVRSSRLHRHDRYPLDKEFGILFTGWNVDVQPQDKLLQRLDDPFEGAKCRPRARWSVPDIWSQTVVLKKRTGTVETEPAAVASKCPNLPCSLMWQKSPSLLGNRSFVASCADSACQGGGQPAVRVMFLHVRS